MTKQIVTQQKDVTHYFKNGLSKEDFLNMYDQIAAEAYDEESIRFKLEDSYSDDELMVYYSAPETDEQYACRKVVEERKAKREEKKKAAEYKKYLELKEKFS